jgi:hypothetical protein
MDLFEAWKSGTVKRFHVMETILPNLVSEHSWGAALVLLMMWPNARPSLITAAILHDFGEKATGDMPGPVKWDNPVLESEMDRMEREHMKARLPEHLCSVVEGLSAGDWGLIEICDRTEFCLRMIYERMLGNKFAEIYYKRAWDKMTGVLNEHRAYFQGLDNSLMVGIVDMRKELDQRWREARA